MTVDIRLLRDSDDQALLDHEVKNKDFFQLYTPLREDDYYTLEYQQKRIQKGRQLAEEGTSYNFGIFLGESHSLIGTLSLTGVAKGSLQCCWIGYCLDEEENGKGYTTEAVKLGVEYAFKELKLHRVEAGVMPHNHGSLRVLEKAGFHREGIAKENVKINGRWSDHVILAIINSEDH
ncbi:GNAT family N-acetyltransferase [Metabacillus sp. GX 13764]|uniref:GNAT family N-acetyltransferase n=1 Tax=Metabacillus kandeliae TaxID=2900151 RepID=UPI001E6264F6|nr:GNAT family protein [Metabacillus kandeliae]MCD7035727.1 GNAT family N-acetyltransferase [Metabacillus kandeliae]